MLWERDLTRRGGEVEERHEDAKGFEVLITEVVREEFKCKGQHMLLGKIGDELISSKPSLLI